MFILPRHFKVILTCFSLLGLRIACVKGPVHEIFLLHSRVSGYLILRFYVKVSADSAEYNLKFLKKIVNSSFKSSMVSFLAC